MECWWESNVVVSEEVVVGVRESQGAGGRMTPGPPSGLSLTPPSSCDLRCSPFGPLTLRT